MLKTAVVTTIILAIYLAGTGFLFAQKQDDKRAVTAEKVKAKVLAHGTGQDAKISVKLYNGSRVKGYVASSDQQGFSVTDPKTGSTTIVAYTDVKSLNGKNLSTGQTIAIGDRDRRLI